jgi:hypothetical protein
MINYSDRQLLLPETVWLEAEDYENATAKSNRVTGERQRWQTYLDLLALSGLKTWLSDRLPTQKITQKDLANSTSYLQVGNFTLRAIAVENLLDEIVHIPQQQLQYPTHFYVVVEVLEEQEEVILRGLLRRDRLDAYLTEPLQPELDYYSLPLSRFDPELNHLVFYCQHLAADAIELPVISTESNSRTIPDLTKLTQWLQDTAITGWSTIENLIDPELNLALSTRNAEREHMRGKLIDIGLEMDRVTMTLLISVREEEEKLKTKIQLYPTNAEQYLPPAVQLNLLSKKGTALQSVQARERDNFIQLKPFKGKTGTRFSLEITLDNAKITENFEL